jgi:hypothetical protein
LDGLPKRSLLGQIGFVIFHGAKRVLREALHHFSHDKLTAELALKVTEWHFIPPGASHMGGMWGRMVQSIKKSLYAVLKEQAPKDGTINSDGGSGVHRQLSTNYICII